MQQAGLGAPDVTSLPSEVIETICEQLERLWPVSQNNCVLKDKVALTSCCCTLWARQDLLASPRLWGSLELNRGHCLSTGHKRASLADWLARHSLGIRRLLLHGSAGIDMDLYYVLNGEDSDAFWPLEHLSSLTNLRFKHVPLNAVPPQLTALPALADLDLGGHIRPTADDPWVPLAACTSLTRLDISGCWLPHHLSCQAALPKELSAMSALRELITADGVFTGVQDLAVAFAVLTSLTTLTSIDMSSCLLMQLPLQLSALPRLQALDLRGNNLGNYNCFRGPQTGPDPAAFQVLPQLGGLTRLDLSSNHLPHAPESLSALAALADLDLSFNSLGSDAALGLVLSTLTTISRLTLVSAKLDRLPPELTRLTCLAVLDVSRNEGLGSANTGGGGGSALWPLQHLSGLTQLGLRNIGLQGTPVDLSACSRLAKLALHGNSGFGGHELLARQLAALPLTLTRLELGACSLHTLPSGISTLTSLAEIDLSSNPELGQSSTLHALESLPGLTRLWIGGSNLSTEAPLLSTLKAKGTVIN